MVDGIITMNDIIVNWVFLVRRFSNPAAGGT